MHKELEVMKPRCKGLWKKCSALIAGMYFRVLSITPLIAKAADKKSGAKQAVKLIKNADKVSNVCGDVIGDICGVLSGATSALIAVNIGLKLNMEDITVITMLLTATVTACTVLRKGYGQAYRNN